MKALKGCVLEMGSHGFELFLEPSTSLNPLSSAGVTGLCHQIWLPLFEGVAQDFAR